MKSRRTIIRIEPVPGGWLGIAADRHGAGYDICELDGAGFVTRVVRPAHSLKEANEALVEIRNRRMSKP